MKKKILLFIIIILLSFTQVNALSDGWETKNGNDYYYENGQKARGLKIIDEKYYYFNIKGVLQKSKLITIDEDIYYAKSDGSLISGWKTISNKEYYFDTNNHKAYKKYHEIDGKIYYFYSGSAVLRKGFHTAGDNLFYSNEEGLVQTGWQTISGKTYYFNEKYPYQALRGYQTIDEKIYYFYSGSAALRKGFHTAGDNLFYSNEEGLVQTGWQTINGKTYYFNEKYPYQALRGYQTIDNKLYYFYLGSRALRTGFHKTTKALYYSNYAGEVQKGWKTINGRKYHFNEKSPYNASIGFKTINDKVLYFNPKGQLVTGSENVNGNTYYCTSEGEFIKISYNPKYYNQKNSKWNNKKYGKYYFGRTGCTPTSLAMAFTSILEKTITPVDVGNYLYNKTSQFNKKGPGTSGYGVIYASKKYNINAVPITSQSMLKDYLKKGNIVYAAMQNGKFATKDWNHAIIVYRLKGEKTYALDPLNKSNNGYVDVSLIWRQKSKDKDDTSGGSALYALVPNK